MRCFGSLSSRVRPENKQAEEELETARKKISELEGKLTSLTRENQEMTKRPDDAGDGSYSSLKQSLEQATRKISELQAALQQATVKDPPVSLEETKQSMSITSSQRPQPPDKAQPTTDPITSWILTDDTRSALREYLSGSLDPKRSKLLRNDLLVTLGVDVSSSQLQSSTDKLSYENFEARVAREWELSRKASSLADMDIVRVLAECIPGGSAESPLAGLQEMTEVALSALCETTIAGRLAAALRRPEKARGREAGDYLSPHNSKYAMNETREAVYGKIEEYYGGLIDRIGLPQPDLMKAIEEEHCRGEDAEEAFVTSNYGITTTSKEEWLNVRDPERRQRLSEGTRIIRGIEELMKHETAIKAGLQEAELIALQLYTGPMYHKYNSVLRAPMEHLRDPRKIPNKYTTTIHCIVSGVVKLSRHTPLPEDRRVWRGLNGLRLPESFLSEDELGVSGGVEYGLLSTTTDVRTAIQYAGDGAEPIVFEMSCGAIDRGASLGFVSQYPGEGEMLYPPLSYLEVVKEPRYREVEGRRVKALELKINANTMSLTIEDFVGRRKQLYVGLMENIAREVERDLRGEEGRIQERLRTATDDSYWERHQDLVSSIVKECWGLVEASRGREAGWYNDESNYKEAIELSNRVKDMAINKLRHWIEDTQGDWKCEALANEPMQSVYWKTMAGLMYKISSWTPATDDVRQEESKRLCGMYGLSISRSDEDGEPPTVTAVVRGQGELISLLKATGCDMDERMKDGRTGLHVAGMLGRAGSVRELIEAGAEVLAKDKEGKTLVHWAAEYGHLEVLKTVEEQCGKEALSTLTLEKSYDSRTCAHLASEGGHLEVLRYVAVTCGEEVLREKDNDGRTCSHMASMGGDVRVVRYVGRTCGEEVLREKDNYGRTCAHWASEGSHLEVLRYLAETCGEELLREMANHGMTCAHWASIGGHLEVLRYLAETCGEEVLREKTIDGWTCLTCARKCSDSNVKDYLRSLGID